MKRSEALNLIWEAINELEDANLILTRLERAGMRPPCCANFGDHGNLTANGDCKEYVESCNFIWEPENE